MQNFYFTFGTDPQYPYGINDYVLIRCPDAGTACKLFNAIHPKRPTHNVMNCAFMYNETQWEMGVKKHYTGREPVETITISRAGD